VSLFRRSRIRRTRRGTYRVELPEEERDLLRRFLPQLRSLLGDEDPDDGRTRRLDPPAYVDDADADADYQRLMREDLVASRLAAIDAVEASVDATELNEQQLLAWLGSVNNLRLVLGTVLDVSEELELGELPEETPDVEAYALYAYLSSLLGEMVDALDPD
jgi:Domain of unknown function (DUF2017)